MPPMLIQSVAVCTSVIKRAIQEGALDALGVDTITRSLAWALSFIHMMEPTDWYAVMCDVPACKKSLEELYEQQKKELALG